MYCIKQLLLFIFVLISAEDIVPFTGLKKHFLSLHALISKIEVGRQLWTVL